jgi:hypothetical protein
MGRACSRHEGVLIGFWWEIKKRPLGRPIHKRENNIKIDLKEDELVWTRSIWLRIWASRGRS